MIRRSRRYVFNTSFIAVFLFLWTCLILITISGLGEDTATIRSSPEYRPAKDVIASTISYQWLPLPTNTTNIRAFETSVVRANTVVHHSKISLDKTETAKENHNNNLSNNFSTVVLRNDSYMSDVRRNDYGLETLKESRSNEDEDLTEFNAHNFHNFIHKEWLNEREFEENNKHQTNGIPENTKEAVQEVENHSVSDMTESFVDTESTKGNDSVNPLYEESLIGNSNDNNYTLYDVNEKEGFSKYDEYMYRKHVQKQYFTDIRNHKGADCPSIVKGDPEAIEYARQIIAHEERDKIHVEKYCRITNCDNFKRTRGYIDDPLSDDEKNFPLAFALIVYRDVEQIERLLRAIYRPHNHYCIHMDTKTKSEEQKAIRAIVNCFDNVFLSSRSINVTWGEFSVLETEMICMEDLMTRKDWKYYINLTGQEFPLKTNREIVKILEAMNGENVVEGDVISARQKYFYRWTRTEGPPPHGIRPVKGSVHVAVVRDFVEFCLQDARARDYLAWLKRTDISDETFFASLNYNTHLDAPGGFKGPLKTIPEKSTFTRYKTWKMTNSSLATPCTGKYIHNICILGVGDIHRAYKDIGLFVNKLHIDFEYLALECLEEVLHERTWQQYLDDVTLNVTIHRDLKQIKYIMTKS